jgi:hypothetical protein
MNSPWTAGRHVPQRTVMSVEHAILAHHGWKEWGSPVEPQTVEVQILHFADMLSCQYGAGADRTKPNVRRRVAECRMDTPERIWGAGRVSKENPPYINRADRARLRRQGWLLSKGALGPELSVFNLRSPQPPDTERQQCQAETGL